MKERNFCQNPLGGGGAGQGYPPILGFIEAIATRAQIWRMRVLAKNLRFWRVLALAKTAVFRYMRDSPESPTLAEPCCKDLPDPPTFAKLFARTRQTNERQVLRKFGKFGKFGKFSECRLDRFIHKNYLSYQALLRQPSPRGLASTHRHSPSHVARTRQTR
jgi:hypothetical protein